MVIMMPTKSYTIILKGNRELTKKEERENRLIKEMLESKCTSEPVNKVKQNDRREIFKSKL